MCYPIEMIIKSCRFALFLRIIIDSLQCWELLGCIPLPLSGLIEPLSEVKLANLISDWWLSHQLDLTHQLRPLASEKPTFRQHFDPKTMLMTLNGISRITFPPQHQNFDLKQQDIDFNTEISTLNTQMLSDLVKILTFRP